MSGPYPYFQSLYNDSLPYPVCPCWLQHQQATGPLYHDLDYWHISGLCDYSIPEIWISNACSFLNHINFIHYQGYPDWLQLR